MMTTRSASFRTPRISSPNTWMTNSITQPPLLPRPRPLQQPHKHQSLRSAPNQVNNQNDHFPLTISYPELKYTHPSHTHRHTLPSLHKPFPPYQTLPPNPEQFKLPTQQVQQTPPCLRPQLSPWNQSPYPSHYPRSTTAAFCPFPNQIQMTNFPYWSGSTSSHSPHRVAPPRSP